MSHSKALRHRREGRVAGRLGPDLEAKDRLLARLLLEMLAAESGEAVDEILGAGEGVEVFRHLRPGRARRGRRRSRPSSGNSDRGCRGSSPPRRRRPAWWCDGSPSARSSARPRRGCGRDAAGCPPSWPKLPAPCPRGCGGQSIHRDALGPRMNVHSHMQSKAGDVKASIVAFGKQARLFPLPNGKEDIPASAYCGSAVEGMNRASPAERRGALRRLPRGQNSPSPAPWRCSSASQRGDGCSPRRGCRTPGRRRSDARFFKKGRGQFSPSSRSGNVGRRRAPLGSMQERPGAGSSLR